MDIGSNLGFAGLSTSGGNTLGDDPTMSWSDFALTRLSAGSIRLRRLELDNLTMRSIRTGCAINQEPDLTDFIRQPDRPIAAVFIERWSPRSFTADPIPDEVIATAFEAARWAPSSANSQPWRFIYAKREDVEFPKFVEVLSEGNRPWAKNAAALILFAAATTFEYQGRIINSPSYAYDAGAAWASFALQAQMLGWHSHGMAGFYRAAARIAFAVPEGIEPIAMAAIGRLGEKAALPEAYQSREAPSDRKPLAEQTFRGGFGAR